METWVGALGELGEGVWDSLLHLSTLPIPVLMRTDPSSAAKGLGRLGAYEMPADLWHRVVPPDFVERAMQYNVEADPEGGAGRIGPGVEPIVATLKEAQVLQPDTSLPSVFPFIIPKSSAKVSLILSCVGMNEFKGKPPRFDLPSWEGVARFLAGAPPGVRYYAMHVDLSNAFWSFVLPPHARRAFRFRATGGGTVYSLDRLPFGWKYSPIICQFALSELVTPLIPKEIILLHYMDDFLLIGPDPAVLARVTALVAEALRTHGFIVSPKSTLSPVERIFFLGKWLDLSARTISSHPRAFLQMLSAWLRVAVRTLNFSRLVGKLAGFMQWHVRPRLGTGPLFAGSYCWMRWGDRS